MAQRLLSLPDAEGALPPLVVCGNGTPGAGGMFRRVERSELSEEAASAVHPS